MNKKLENRIVRLEKLLNGRKRRTNERNGELARALDFVGRAATKAYNALNDENVSSDVGDISVWSDNEGVMYAYDKACAALDDLLDTISEASANNDSF